MCSLNVAPPAHPLRFRLPGRGVPLRRRRVHGPLRDVRGMRGPGRRGAGQWMCTRGCGQVACRECAHAQAAPAVERYGVRTAERLAADLRRGQSLRRPLSFALARPVVDGWSTVGGAFGPSIT